MASSGSTHPCAYSEPSIKDRLINQLEFDTHSRVQNKRTGGIKHKHGVFFPKQ